MSPAEPEQAPEPDPVEAEIDEILAEHGGDARAAIRALLHDMDALIADADRSASRGYLRGRFSAGARPPRSDDK